MKNNYNMFIQKSIFFGFIYFIILVKILFLFFVIWNLYLQKKNGNTNDENQIKLKKMVTYYKKLSENIFIILVSILLIYLFNPYYNNTYLDNLYVKAIFFVYGILMLITFDWSQLKNQ
jgi:hypothetical protein